MTNTDTNSAPIVVDAVHTAAALPFDRLIPALREAFITGAEVPLRHAHVLTAPDEQDASLLLMPAWQHRKALGVKIVNVFPGNNARGLNSISATYLLCDGATGRHLAIIDGNELTSRRTAAASAFAGTYLARADASSLLIVGAGHVASMLASAWKAVRPIARVRVWNRNPERAVSLASALRAQGFDAERAEDLEAAAHTADIISCATLSTVPLIRGAWLRSGTHIDLIGAYVRTMREADDDAMRRARVYIDTPAALEEAGDITQAIASGALDPSAIAGTLATLCKGEALGRANADEITLFKSVGSAIEDLAAAMLVYTSSPSAIANHR
jgi:ornithine cyclodeaminase